MKIELTDEEVILLVVAAIRTGAVDHDLNGLVVKAEWEFGRVTALKLEIKEAGVPPKNEPGPI